jgi:hypothetical protein
MVNPFEGNILMNGERQGTKKQPVFWTIFYVSAILILLLDASKDFSYQSPCGT